MAEMYHVVMKVHGEGSKATFEFEDNAIEVAKALVEAGHKAHVTDEFTEGEDGYPAQVWPEDKR